MRTVRSKGDCEGVPWYGWNERLPAFWMRIGISCEWERERECALVKVEWSGVDFVVGIISVLFKDLVREREILNTTFVLLRNEGLVETGRQLQPANYNADSNMPVFCLHFSLLYVVKWVITFWSLNFIK